MGLRRAVLLVASCGVGATFVGAAVGGTAAAQPAVAPSRTITVTQADSGRTYHLHTGDHLHIRLSGPSFTNWNEPVSSNQAVLQRTGGSSGDPATGTFAAKVTGQAKVTATGNYNCPVCLGPILGFLVTVSVVG
jgi:hypothetical protein